ncbi:MAG: anti-sigma factor family protein [Micromonosporaceae bacterium]
MADKPEPTDQRCVDVVELLTAYLDGALTDDVKRQVDAHLEGCPGCRAALDQWRTVAGLAGKLSPEEIASLDPYVRDRLLATLVKPRRR